MELPGDVLRVVFGRVLAGPSDLSGPTLHRLAGQWFALRSVCRHWASVLQQTPVCVDIETASPAALSWLATVPVVLLRIGRFGPLFRDRRYKSAPQLNEQLQLQLQLGASGRGGRSAPAGGEAVTAAALIDALSDPGSNTTLGHWWSGANLSLLQVLHLKGSLSPSGEPANFAAAPLSGLASLTHLHLERFTHFDLAGLPPQLRVLKLRYQEAPMFSSHPHPSLDIVRLPPTARLDLLEVDSRASLGLLAGELSAQCSALVVRATRAFVGVPGPFPKEDIADFHDLGGRRAQEEGLQRKAEVMAAAARQFLLLLARGGDGGSAGGSGTNSWGGGRSQGHGGSDSGSGGGSGWEGARAGMERMPDVSSRLSSVEFKWMCADTLVFVPLPEPEPGALPAEERSGSSSGQGSNASLGHRQEQQLGRAGGAAAAAAAAVPAAAEAASCRTRVVPGGTQAPSTEAGSAAAPARATPTAAGASWQVQAAMAGDRQTRVAHALLGGSMPSGGHGMAWHGLEGLAVVALESAQAAVHEGEEPVVDISAALLAGLAQELQEEQQRQRQWEQRQRQAREGLGRQQQDSEQQRGVVRVDIGRGAGHQQVMLLRLSAVALE